MVRQEKYYFSLEESNVTGQYLSFGLAVFIVKRRKRQISFGVPNAKTKQYYVNEQNHLKLHKTSYINFFISIFSFMNLS